MSEEREVKKSERGENQTSAPPKMNRRALLRNTVVGMPAILTLHSGAALARSSNMVGIAPPGTRDLKGNALCVDPRTAQVHADSNQIDFGEPARGSVNILPERVYYPAKNKSGTPANADMVCNHGGTHYYHAEGWHEVSLPANGAIVSATAMVSVSLRGHVLFNRIS